MLTTITVILISYLVGSLPTAYIFGRLLKGIDIRTAGSGNVGATNALRVLGKGPGIAVLIIDIAKGLAAVLVLGAVCRRAIDADLLRILLGLACIAGHNWTVFLGFKGGKGMATSLGVLLALGLTIAGMRYALVLVILVWFVVFLFSRIVSLSSVVSAAALPVFMIVTRQSAVLVGFSLLLAGFVAVRHRANIGRLRKGIEPQLKFK